MKYSVINFFSVLVVILFFLSCENSEEVQNINFEPLKEFQITEFDEELTRKDNYELVKSIELPDFVGAVVRIQSSEGEIYFNDLNSIFTYNRSNDQIEEFIDPNKGKGPSEVSNIFRFDILKDKYVIISNYPEKNLLYYDLVSDTAYKIQTEYDNEVIALKGLENLLAFQANNLSGFMFQELSLNGVPGRKFGNYFQNQEKSLDLFNTHLDTYNGSSNIILGFNSVGYFIGLDDSGETQFFSESSIYPGFIPRYVKRNGYSFFDTEGKMVSNSLSVGREEFHVFTRLIGNKQNEIIGTQIDVFDLKTGSYNYTYQVNEEIIEFEIVNDELMVAITQDHELVFYQKSK